MSLPASVLDAMVAAGCTPEQIVAAVKASDRDAESAVTDRRARAAERKRRQRERERSESHTMSQGQSVTDGDGAGQKETFPHTPIQEKQVPPSPPKGGSSPEVQQAFDAFASMAKSSGIPAPRVINDQRRRKMAGLIRTEGMPRILEAISAIGTSDFCRGQNDRGWTADLDFLLQPKSFAGLLEGKYANRAQQPRGSPPRKNPQLTVLDSLIGDMTNARPDQDSRTAQAPPLRLSSGSQY